MASSLPPPGLTKSGGCTGEITNEPGNIPIAFFVPRGSSESRDHSAGGRDLNRARIVDSKESHHRLRPADSGRPLHACRVMHRLRQRHKQYDGNGGSPGPLRVLLESWPLLCARPPRRQLVTLASRSKSHLGRPVSLQGESQLFSGLLHVFPSAAVQRKFEKPREVD